MFWEMDFLTLRLKKFLYFFKKIVLVFLEMDLFKNFLDFRRELYELKK